MAAFDQSPPIDVFVESFMSGDGFEFRNGLSSKGFDIEPDLVAVFSGYGIFDGAVIENDRFRYQFETERFFDRFDSSGNGCYSLVGIGDFPLQSGEPGSLIAEREPVAGMQESDGSVTNLLHPQPRTAVFIFKLQVKPLLRTDRPPPVTFGKKE